MGRPKSAPEPDAEDIRLILLCKEERKRLRKELSSIGANGRRRIEHARRLRKIRDELDELTDSKLAEKFGLTRWIVSRL